MPTGRDRLLFDAQLATTAPRIAAAFAIGQAVAVGGALLQTQARIARHVRAGARLLCRA